MSALHLEVRGVGLAVGRDDPRRWLVRGLELDVRAGDWVAVVGPSGAGKSTLLRALAGLRAPDEGRIALDDQALGAMAPRARARRIAYLPQHGEPWLELPVRELVLLGRLPHLGRLARPGPRERELADVALAQVGAAALAERAWSSLSGGERQRVMLARMLITDAPLLLLDEPTTGLDIGAAARMLAACAPLVASGRAIVMAMHDLELARQHARTVVCLGRDGVRVGATDDVLTVEHVARAFDVHVRVGPRMIFEVDETR